MTPTEMEQEIKILTAQALAIERILPTLATKEDLKVFATKDDLKAFATKEDLKAFPTREELRQELQLTIAALQHEMQTGFANAKSYARSLNDVTREQIRIVAAQMAQRSDLDELRDGLRSELRRAMLGVKRSLRADIRALSRQLAASLPSPRTNGPKPRR